MNCLILARAAGVPAEASDTTLADAWQDYRATYIADDGRVIDRGADDRSTSEGQAYAMTRAVWAGDRATFEQVHAWTRANLQGGDPGRLPAWVWGRRSDGNWGVIDPAPAADADQWMAWALVGAARTWKQPAWEDEARALLGRIWVEETREIAGKRYLLPGPWAQTQAPVQLNPSYWLPFAWRDFARVDPAHDWNALLDPAYAAFEQCRTSSGLVPDWCWMQVNDGAVIPAPRGQEAHDDFGFEALRVPWTLAAEVRWHKERRAQRLLGPYGDLAVRWKANGSVPAILTPDGRARVEWESLSMLGGLLPVWGIVHPDLARRMWTNGLQSQRGAHGWGPPTDYYAQNWVWFGYALWSGAAQTWSKP